ALEHVIHRVLVPRALRLGFNPWLLKFPLSLYTGPRFISAQGLCGDIVKATRTIIAGCAFADLLMRCMIVPDLDVQVGAFKYAQYGRPLPAAARNLGVDFALALRRGLLHRVRQKRFKGASQRARRAARLRKAGGPV
ncbi:unnamed protein product, partial [Prorocentrum cordatum]